MRIKRILCLALAALLCVGTLASCRTKDELAFKYKTDEGNINVKTALYQCFLIEADQEFQSHATEEAEEESVEYEEYEELKYEDKDYETWVKDTARELCDEYAFYELEFERLGLSIAEDEGDYLEQNYFLPYWEQYYQEVYEANGISYDTYITYMTSSYKKDLVYNYYTEEPEDETETTTTTTATTAATKKGETTVATTTVPTTKAVSAEIKKLNGSYRPKDSKINATLKNNYVLVDQISVSFTDDNGNEIGDDTKAEYLKKFKAYAKQIKSGTSFADIYTAYTTDFNVSTDSTDASTDTTTQYETVLASAQANKTADSGHDADEHFSDFMKMSNGDVEVKEYDDSYVLVLRKNIMKDTNSSGTAYADEYSAGAIDILVRDKFIKEVVDTAIEKFEVEENNSAIKFYSPDKIDYLDETTTTTAYNTAVAE